MGSLGLYKNGKLIEKVKFPVTRAGDKSIVKYTVRNEVGNFMIIDKIILHHPEVKIEKAPKSLEPLENSEIIFSWSPAKESTSALRTLVEFEVIIGREE